MCCDCPWYQNKSTNKVRTYCVTPKDFVIAMLRSTISVNHNLVRGQYNDTPPNMLLESYGMGL